MDENLKMASSDESNPEILGEGPLSHGITDKVLEFAYGWHFRRQTFTSMEEAELDNQAASMAIRHNIPSSINTSSEERLLFIKEAIKQFKKHNEEYNSLKIQGKNEEKQARSQRYQTRLRDYLMHPHATQSLVQEQSAARICLELQPLRLTAQQRLIDTDERLEQAAMQTASGRRLTPATPFDRGRCLAKPEHPQSTGCESR